MKIEINKTIEANFEVPEHIPEEWKEFVKNQMEVSEIRKKLREITQEITNKLPAVVKPTSNITTEIDDCYTATEIGLLVDKTCSIIRKMMNTTGLKEESIKVIIDIKDGNEIVYKYYYKYETVIKFLQKLNLFIDNIPSKEELKELVWIKKKIEEFEFDLDEDDYKLLCKYKLN